MMGSIVLEYRLVQTPIANLAAAATRLSQRDFSATLPKPKNDEIGKLIKSFDLMRCNLQVHQEELCQARDKALEATRVKSQFLAQMSHELRTPLNAIIGYCELLEEELMGEVSKQKVEDLGKINCSARHLLTLISDILDISKIEAGKLELEIGKFSLHNLVTQVVGSMQPLADYNGNTFKLALDPQTDTIVNDKTKIKQILYNLLSNSCKFTKNGTILVRTNKLNDKGGDYFKVDVEDNGIGIDKEKQETLFDVFTQIDTSYNRQYDGAGLGLALCRQLCELMRGHISLQSEPNKGSVFTFYLPTILEETAAVTSRA
jgi:signal transduction histidine kinase